MLSTAARLVQVFTDRLVREYPALDLEDVQGEFWLAAAEAMRSWEPDGGAAFATHLWWQLRAARKSIINHLVKQGRVSALFRTRSMTVDPIEPGTEERWKRLLDTLKEDERQVLELMMNPSPVFLRYVKQCWQERRLRYQSRGTKFTVQQVHYARFLGLPPMKVTRTIRRIQRIAQEVFNVER